MSYEKSKAYREYALIQSINLLVNSVEQVLEAKEKLINVSQIWLKSGMLGFGEQIELIFGTAADNVRSEYMVICINKLNKYMMSKYPNHVGYIIKLTCDVIEAINKASKAHAHIWESAKIKAILSGFSSGRVAKSLPFYKSDKEIKKNQANKQYEQQAI